jgi:hypothetical protein
LNQIVFNSKKANLQSRSINSCSSTPSDNFNTNNNTSYNNNNANLNGYSNVSYTNQANQNIKNIPPFLNNPMINQNQMSPSNVNYLPAPNMKNNMPYMDNNKNMPNIFNNIPFINSNIPNLNNNTSYLYNNMPSLNNNIPYLYNNMPNISNNTPYLYNNMPNINNNIPFINTMPNMTNNVPYMHNEFVRQCFQRQQQSFNTRSKSLAPPNHQNQQNAYPYFSQKDDSIPNPNKQVPEYIKNQIESIVSDAEGKIKVSNLFKEYLRRYKRDLISDSFNFPSFKNLILSFGNLFSIEEIPNSYEYYICKCAPLENKNKNVVDENNNNQSSCPISTNKNDNTDTEKCEFTEVNEYQEILDSTEIKTKKTSIKHVEKSNQNQDLEIVYNFNLISIRDGTTGKIYIHWLQVANLFEINPSAFKRNYLRNMKRPLNQCVSKYKMNENNKVLFDFLEAKLNVNLKDYDDEGETTLFLKDSLNEVCDYVFNKNNSQILKEIIKKI